MKLQKAVFLTNQIQGIGGHGRAAEWCRCLKAIFRNTYQGVGNVAFQATKQREGGPVENIGPSNNSLKQVGNTIIDDAAIEAVTYLSAQPGPSGFNLVILIDTASAQYGTDISVKGDFTDRASYRGKLDGVVVDPVNEILSNV